ncbi:Cupredoxin [Mycena leptocephala]|nr:Cupredoxin [Mycena leptocephala]
MRSFAKTIMPAAWRDADEALRMARSNGFHETGFTRLSRKRLSTRSVVVFLVLPLAFLLWFASLTRPTWTSRRPDSSLLGSISIPDAFNLDSAFDYLAPPRSRVYRWTVSAVAVPNTNRTRLVVNGRSPGPIIEANVHDRILVYLTNGLDKAGTLDRSIVRQARPSPTTTPFYDGPAGISQCPVPPAATLLYNFTFGGWTGTTWWHGHTGMQHTDGIFGPIVVHSPDERTSEYASDHVLTMSDEYDTPQTTSWRNISLCVFPSFSSILRLSPRILIYFSNSAWVHPFWSRPSTHSPQCSITLLLGEFPYLLPFILISTSIEPVPEPVPDRAEINGLGSGPHDEDAQNKPRTRRSNVDTKYFEVRARAGTTTRLRFIHAGTFAPLRVSVDGHALTLIEADGTPLEPRRVREVVLQAAQRYSVLVTRDARDEREAFWIRSRLVEDEFGYNTRTRSQRLALFCDTRRPGPIEGHLSHSPDRFLRRVRDRPIEMLPSGGTRCRSSMNGRSGQRTQFSPRQSTSAEDPNTDSDDNSEDDPGARGDSEALKDDNIGLPDCPENKSPPPPTLPFIFSIQRTEEQNWRSFINETHLGGSAGAPRGTCEDIAGILAGGKSGVRVWPGNQLIATFVHGQTIDFIITNLDDGIIHSPTWIFGRLNILSAVFLS